MFTSKSWAVVVCAMATFLLVAEESQAQSRSKAGSSTSRSRSSQGSEKKPVKVNGRLSGDLSATAMMTVFDSNGDHVVSKKEVSTVLELLTGLDANGDGRITAEEMSDESIMAVAPHFAEEKRRALKEKEEMNERMERKEERGMNEKTDAGSQAKSDTSNDGFSNR